MIDAYLSLPDIEGFKKRSSTSDSAIFVEDHGLFIFKGEVYRKTPI